MATEDFSDGQYSSFKDWIQVKNEALEFNVWEEAEKKRRKWAYVYLNISLCFSIAILASRIFYIRADLLVIFLAFSVILLIIGVDFLREARNLERWAANLN